MTRSRAFIGRDVGFVGLLPFNGFEENPRDGKP